MNTPWTVLKSCSELACSVEHLSFQLGVFVFFTSISPETSMWCVWTCQEAGGQVAPGPRTTALRVRPAESTRSVRVFVCVRVSVVTTDRAECNTILNWSFFFCFADPKNYPICEKDQNRGFCDLLHPCSTETTTKTCAHRQQLAAVVTAGDAAQTRCIRSVIYNNNNLLFSKR